MCAYSEVLKSLSQLLSRVLKIAVSVFMFKNTYFVENKRGILDWKNVSEIG